MTANILVVTFDSPLGEFIRLGLEERGQFNIHVTNGLKKAVTFLLETDCTLALIDPGENRGSIPHLLRKLRETRPALKVILLAETGWQELAEELEPDQTLYKPFSLPELIVAVGKFHPLEEPPAPVQIQDVEPRLPGWLSNVHRAAGRLRQLTVESSSQAALITDTEQLWAYAGQLPQEAARELAATVIRYWDREEENDLVRFVKLVSTEAEHMLYATRLAPGKVLALVFDAETPYSMIRSQAGQLKHTLSITTDKEQGTAVGECNPAENSREHIARLLQASEQGEPSTRDIGVIDDASQVDEAFHRLFSPLPPRDTADEFTRFGGAGLAPISAPSLFQRVGIDSGKLEVQPVIDPSAADLEEPSHGLDQEEDVAQGLLPVPRRLVLESATASVYNLDYVCVLIPRFSHHLLTGDLSERLGDWLPQLCLAYTWRLEYLSIRPEFLQWIANVPPATSPAYFMRILRQHTSEKIFLEFPRYKRENPSGDFWAPGYLIMGGSQPPPSQLIKDYIAQTRQRQGLLQSY